MTTTASASSPTGPSNHNISPGSYGSYPYSWVTTTSAPSYSDEVVVACLDCGLEYRKRAASAADAERACEVWLDGHRTAKHSQPAPGHATLSDGTVLRERTGASLGLTGDAAGSSSHGLLRIAAHHLDDAVLQPGKTELDDADLCAIRTLVSGVARLAS